MDQPPSGPIPIKPRSNDRAAQAELIAFVLLATFGFVVVLLRSLWMTSTQDEAISYWRYVDTGEFLPFRSHLDAGNHVLSSLLGIIGKWVAGPSLSAVRWGSVAAFICYAWAVRVLTTPMHHRFVRICTWSALLLCPYLLDFFSLFRGYGPAMACWAWAMVGFQRAMISWSLKGLWLMAISMFLGVYADLSLLPCWALMMVLASFRYFTIGGRAHRDHRSFLLITVVQLAGFVYAARFALLLGREGLLYYGSGEGYYKVTVTTLVGAVLNTQDPVVIALIAAMVLLAMLFIIIDAKVERALFSAQVLWVVLLVGDVLAREAIHVLFGTNFPRDRAALQLVPLVICLLGYAVDRGANRRPQLALLACSLLVLPVRCIYYIDLSSTLNRTTIPIPGKFNERVAQLQQELGRPIMLSGWGQFQECWSLNGFEQGTAVTPMRRDPQAVDPDDVRVLPAHLLQELGQGYRIVETDKDGDALLLFKDAPEQLGPEKVISLPDMSGDMEFIGLPPPDDMGAEVLMLRIQGHVHTPAPGHELRLVTDVADPIGHRRYDAVPMPFSWLRSNDGQLDVMFLVPPGPATGRHVYLYNPGRRWFELNDLRMCYRTVWSGSDERE